MIQFPVFHCIRVDGYLMFPGGANSPGLDIKIKKGPTLIAGVNGLGKTTLVEIVLRTLTGPFDIPKAAQGGDLSEVEPKPISINAQSIFASRVADGAKEATASLELSFGGRRMKIERNLANLELVECNLSNPDENIADEKSYQSCLTKHMGLGSFFDALLILRYVVFLMEDRRALVWGKTAQREILRALFVEPKMASKISSLRYKMLSTDSAFRNMRNVLNRRIKENIREISKVTGVSKVRTELAILEAELSALRTEEDKFESLVALEETKRQNARLVGAKAALDRDSALRELERAKVQVLRGKFQDLEESGLYVLSRLLSEDQCLVCDTQEPGLGREISVRLKSGDCPVCGTPRKASPSDDIVDLTKARIADLQERMRLGEEQVRSSDLELHRANDARRQALESQYVANKRKLDLSEQIRALRKRLPSTEQSADDLDQRNRELQRTIDEEELRYKHQREIFEKALSKSRGAVEKSHHAVAKAFSRYAGEFLKERCRIAFQPVSVRIGQSGSEFEVNLFRLSMSGATVGGETPRTEPDQVSLSQREFLDLAFRMALMNVASGNGPSTLVVDTPESSLDFLFAERAGNQLAKFASGGGDVGNRVIITSNLANPEIIPAFLAGRPKRTPAKSRVVDLLKIAAPTAAVRDDLDTYSRFLTEQIGKS